MRLPKLFFCFLLFFNSPVFAGSSVRLEVIPQQSEVQFVSDAVLETFSGKTKNVSGWLECDVEKLGATRASFIVQAASLNTGNRLRDKRMRNDFLETDKFSDIRFDLKRVVSPVSRLESGKKVELTGEGDFLIHGVTRNESIPLQVTYDQGQKSVTVQSQFPIRLSDYQIERPQVLWFKLAETVEVKLNFVLK